MFFRRPATDPLDTGRLLCAYCTSDWLDWERAPSDAPAPALHPAVTVLPATVEGQAGGAAVCGMHLRPLLRTRRLMAERVADTGKPHAESWTRPVPRLTSEAATA